MSDITTKKDNNTAYFLHEYNDNRKGNISSHLTFYMLSDVVSLFIGFSLALLSAFAVNDFMGRGDVFLYQLDITKIFSFLLISGGVFLWFSYKNHYRVRMNLWHEIQSVVPTIGFALLVHGFLQFASKQDGSRLLVILGWTFTAISIISLRMLVRKIAMKKSKFQLPSILIGSGVNADQVRQAIKSSPELGYEIVAQIKNLPESFMQSGRSWKKLCAEYGAKHIILALDSSDNNGSEKIVAKLTRESVSFSIVPHTHKLPVTGMVSQYFINHNIMMLTHGDTLERFAPQFAKRFFDVSVSFTALVVLSPLMLIIAALVKMDGGAALFGHNRIGKNGTTFPCWKFRSMITNSAEVLKKHLAENPEAETEWKATQKLKNDPRVTKIGKFLRATSLDELPQLINVLKGDMSLVGPRPIVKDEVAHYDKEIFYYNRVRPGVTGLWQVSGRSDVSYAERVQMDSWYVRNWSLWHDIAILFKTIPAVLKRSGAY